MSSKFQLNKHILRIEMPVHEPRVSGSGKTLVLASTRGQVNTGIDYHGSNVIVVANAFVENPNKQTRAKHRHRKNEHRKSEK